MTKLIAGLPVTVLSAPVSVKERPHCRFCGATLKPKSICDPITESDEHGTRIVSWNQVFIGYGLNAKGYFCNPQCATDFANMMLDKSIVYGTSEYIKSIQGGKQ